MIESKIEYYPVTAKWVEQLSSFFYALVVAKQDTWFHPHALNSKMARYISKYNGFDYYVVQCLQLNVVGYGMLRGWEKGFDTPTLGLAICPGHQRKGLGKQLLEHLHETAVERGALKVRLKVYPNNVSAIRLYHSAVYKLVDEENGQIVGYKEL